MTRLLQAMAGAPHGGAEAFFERLAIALHHAGETQQLVIRREPSRGGAAARARGCAVEEVAVRPARSISSPRGASPPSRANSSRASC